MRLLVCTTGTQGDVQPCVAVARGLQQAGHEVEVASATAFQPLIESAGLPFLRLDEPDPRRVMRDVQQGTLGQSARIRLFKHLFRRRPPPAHALARQKELCAGRDMVLSHISNYLHLTESLGLPFVYLAAYPTLPTSEFPHHLSRIPVSLGGPLNRLTHLLFRQLFWLPDREWVNAWRADLGLPALGFSGPHPQAVRRGVPYLFGYSPALLPRPADWPAQAKVTGFWFLDTTTKYQPPPDLLQFLDSGPPPVVMAFGSLVDPNPPELQRHLFAALEQTGQRGLVLAGWNLDQTTLPPNIFRANWVPLPWLLPRVRAVIHHSGAGTTSEILRAAVPSVPLPYSGEQKFWGRRLHQLGLASAPLPRSKLETQPLVQRLEFVLHNPQLPERLRTMSQKLRAENGVEQAVRLIEEFASSRGKTRKA